MATVDLKVRGYNVGEQGGSQRPLKSGSTQDALAHHHRHRKQGLTWAGSIKRTAWVTTGSSPGFGG